MRDCRSGIALVDVCIGLAIVALGAVLALGLGNISFGAGYDRIGPRFFPYVIASGLLVLGAWFLVSGFLRHSTQRQTASTYAVNWRAIGCLGAALVLTLLLLERGGFVIACSIQFWFVARAFGSRRPVRDGLAAIALSLVCFIAFSKGLGLTLPSGVLEGIL
jgi:putative tricarboxylic transport membrane protein